MSSLPEYARKQLVFIPCDTCRAKPGSPLLCAGCLHNRTVIDRLTPQTFLQVRQVAQRIKAAFTTTRCTTGDIACWDPECPEHGR